MASASNLANVEAEAAFLGAVLIDNTILERISVPLAPAHFLEPNHARIFERTLQLLKTTPVVTAVTLRPYFEADEGLNALGGVTYLARLAADYQGLLAPRELAEQIYELAQRRCLFADLNRVRTSCLDPSEPLDLLTGDLAALIERMGAARQTQRRALDLAALAETEPKPRAMAIERIAPLGEVTLFTGYGGVGKSLLGQQIATCSAAGRSVLGLHVAAAPSVYLTCEDGADQLHFRQANLCDALGVKMASLAGRLHLHSLRGELENELCQYLPDGSSIPGPTFRWLQGEITRTGAMLAVLDNVAHLFRGNENDRGDVTRFVNLLNRLAGETGAAVVLIGHPNKAGADYSGSTAWLNAVRSHVVLDHVKDEAGEVADPDARVIRLGKSNYGRAGDTIKARWHNWSFVRDEDLPADTRAELAATVAANGENAAFLRCLDLRNNQERPVSDSPASRTFAPKEFAAMAEARGLKRHQLEAAMDRLFRTGEIEIGWVCRTGRKDRFGLRRKCADLRADPAPTGCADPAPTPRRRALSHTLRDKSLTGAALKAGTPDDDEEGRADD